MFLYKNKLTTKAVFLPCIPRQSTLHTHRTPPVQAHPGAIHATTAIVLLSLLLRTTQALSDVPHAHEPVCIARRCVPTAAVIETDGADLVLRPLQKNRRCLDSRWQQLLWLGAAEATATATAMWFVKL